MLYQLLQLHPVRALSRTLWRPLCLLALCLLAACAAPFDADARLSADVPTRAQVTGVPLIQQEAFFCGPTSIAMVMQWAGATVAPADIAQLAFTPGAGGTYQADMIGSSRRLGQLVVPLTGMDDLLTEVAAGHPVIVFQNLGVAIAPVWHYGVVTSYDLDRETISLNSGQRAQMIMPIGVFDRSWARGEYWGVVVLPPDQLPATAKEEDVLAAGAALERIDRYEAAIAAYQTGATRWPDSWLWQFGLGNAHYANGDLRAARRALRRARAIDPTIPEVRSNLAVVEAALAA